MAHNFKKTIKTLLVIVLLLGFTPVTKAQYGYHFGRNKVQYESFDWQILKTEHLDIYYYPEMQELAEYGAAFAESVFLELENKFAFTLTHRIPMIFYSSNLHFKQTNITPGFIPDGVGGFFEFLKGRVVVPSNGNIHRFKRVIRHELVHVFTFNKVTRVLRDHRKVTDRFLPLWFTEGLAEYWSGEPDYQHEMMIRDAVSSNYLVPIKDMLRINGSYLMYKQGEAICRFIAEEYGEEKILRLIDNFWYDKNFDKVLEFVLQEHIDVISKKWDDWLRSQYYPLLADTDVSSQIATQITQRGFGSKPTFYHASDGTRFVYYVGNMNGYTNIFQQVVDSSYTPLGSPKILIKGERSEQYEAFHVFESNMDIAPNGLLAFVTKQGDRDAIHIFDVEENERKGSFTFKNLVAIYSPSWNADGSKIVFSGIERNGFSDLFLYDIATEQLSKLTNDPYDDRSPDWHPSTNQIVFSSDRTTMGLSEAYNLFSYNLETNEISYLTFGNQIDQSPRWSPDGKRIVYTSTKKEGKKFSAQNIWTLEVNQNQFGIEKIVSEAKADPEPIAASPTLRSNEVNQLTKINAAIFDPIWTSDNHILAWGIENYRFNIRNFGHIDSLQSNKRASHPVVVDTPQHHWAFNKLTTTTHEDIKKLPYKKKYTLDAAQTQVSQNAVFGTQGGGYVAFSDVLGDDHWLVYLYNTSTTTSSFLKSLSMAVSRYQLKRRTNISYGVYRYGGLRYDLTDPDVSLAYPVYYENLLGGYGAISYPISFFKRLEFSTSLTHSHKEIQLRDINRQALLLSNSVSWVHDNTLYGMNGPVEGWRANFSGAYTTDVRFSNVNYFTAIADIRHYWRLSPRVTFASRVMGRINEGKEARLFYLGGSWDMRGFGLYDIRGRKNWFTSHELRFPIMDAPSLMIPVLEPFGIANLKGALFFDATHAWNNAYDERIDQILAGQTLGATGLGLRMNLFGGLLLRYDLGFRFTDNFSERTFFKQFFFGWDF